MTRGLEDSTMFATMIEGIREAVKNLDQIEVSAEKVNALDT